MFDSNREAAERLLASERGISENPLWNRMLANTIDMLDVPFTSIDHVQVAMPAGQEDAARRFYVDVLRMIELPKPPELAKRGGCWFKSGCVQVHLGVETDFRPARTAHPAFGCRDYESLLTRLRGAGIDVNEVDDIPGVHRCHFHDPFGNRIELIES